MILLCYLLLIAFTGARGFITHRLLRRQYRAGNGLRRLVIIGDGASARECLRRVKKGRDAGWTVIGSVGASALSGVPHLGSYDSLRTALEMNAPDEAVIAMEENQAERLGGILRECEDTGVKLALLPIGYEYMSRHPYVEELCGLPLVNVRRVPLGQCRARTSSSVFLIFSRVLFSLFSHRPSCSVAADRHAPFLSGAGPVPAGAYRKDKKPFYMLKFRAPARERAVGHGVDARP